MSKAKNYSDSIQRLDEILEAIDQEQVPIDQLADKVMEAADLLKNCKKVLTQTEARVSQVLDDLEKEFGEGEITLEQKVAKFEESLEITEEDEKEEGEEDSAKNG